MRIVSINIGDKVKVSWKGREVETGIFKYPVGELIYLDHEDVRGDHVADRRVHGGVDKACYLYPADRYDFWKEKYPAPDWDYGMFGENLTVGGLDESRVKIGSVYRIGTAVVQVTQPRQPCFKLGIRFGTQQVLKDFIAWGWPGIYVRVLKPGEVRQGDTLMLEEEADSLSVRDIFRLLYGIHDNPGLIHQAIGLKELAESARRDLKKWL